MADYMNQHYDPDCRAKWNKLVDEDEKLVKEQTGADYHLTRADGLVPSDGTRSVAIL